MIKAVVFDLGGVLFAEGKSVAVERLEKEHGYQREIVRRILVSPKSMDLRKGLIKDDEFWSWAQARLPAGYDALLIKKAWYDAYELVEESRLRPEDIVLGRDGEIPCRVEVRNYMGNLIDYRVSAARQILRVQTPNTEIFEEGDELGFTINRAMLLTFGGRTAG